MDEINDDIKDETKSAPKRAKARKSERAASTGETGTPAVKAALRLMEKATQKFRDLGDSVSPGLTTSPPLSSPVPLDPGMAGTTIPASPAASPAASAPEPPVTGDLGSTSAASPEQGTAALIDTAVIAAQEIDLKPWREFVSAQAYLIWKVRGGDPVANWLLAEDVVRRVVARTHQ